MQDSNCLGYLKIAGKFDKALNHISGNLNMQNFLGNNLMVSLYKIIHPDDAKKVSDVLEKCVTDGSQRELVRIQNSKEEYETYIFKTTYDKEKQDYDVELTNAEECDHNISRLNDKINELRAFLTVENNILFQYDDETGDFKIFWITGTLDVAIYEMKFDLWQEQMVSLGYVSGDADLEAFHNMCAHIKNLKGGSNLTFRSKIITKGERVDINRVKFMPVISEQGTAKVVGRWNLINEANDAALEDFCVDSYLDPLTELLNKKAITDYAKEAVLDRNKKRVALAMLDLDNFKQVNDTYGHMFGDEVLKSAGKIIKEAISGMGVAGRMGGDEFFMVFNDYVDELHLRNVLRTIKINIASMYQGKIGDIPLSCSIGASRSDVDSNDYYKLFKVADKALYLAKQKGRNRYIIYKTELHGEFKFDENASQVEMKTDYYDETDIRDVSKWMKKVIVNGKVEIYRLLEHMATSFHFDRIGIYLENGARTEYEYRKPGITPGVGLMIRDKEYLEMFKNDMILAENVNKFEYGMQGVYSLFKESETKSTIQLLIRDMNDEVVGVISFDSCRAYVTYPKKLMEYVSAYGNVIAGIVVKDKE